GAMMSEEARRGIGDPADEGYGTHGDESSWVCVRLTTAPMRSIPRKIKGVLVEPCQVSTEECPVSPVLGRCSSIPVVSGSSPVVSMRSCGIITSSAKGGHMADNGLIVVTGAAGQLGAVGRTVTELLLDRGLPVRAMVRREDERAAALRAAGAEVVVGDLLEPADVYRVVSGVRRVYFAISVSPGYFEATLTMAPVAPE